MRTVFNLFKRHPFLAVTIACVVAVPIAWNFFWRAPSGCEKTGNSIGPAGSSTASLELCTDWREIKPFRKLRGVALVVHGLNLKPERMGDIIQCLNRTGIDVLRVTLRGHGRNYQPSGNLPEEDARLESFREVDYRLWMQEIESGYGLAEERARRKGVPLYLIGYSLGGLLGCDFVLRSPGKNFDGIILFAPALNVRAESYLLKAMTPFPNLVIDSLSPPWYRANKGTPMSAYKALFEAIDHVEKNADQRLNRPALLFIDREDELISYDGIKEFIEKYKLDRWRIMTLTKSPDAEKGISRHLIIDRGSMGKDAWKQIEEEIARFLRNQAACAPFRTGVLISPLKNLFHCSAQSSR